MHEAEEEEPGFVGGRVQDEAEAARADGAEAPQQLEDDAQPRQDEAVQVARPDVLVERGQAWNKPNSGTDVSKKVKG